MAAPKGQNPLKVSPTGHFLCLWLNYDWIAAAVIDISQNNILIVDLFYRATHSADASK